MTNNDPMINNPMINSEEDTVNEETKINTEDKIDTETKINTEAPEPAKAKRTPAIRCPRCSKRMVKPVERNALSRVDNKTYICSTCGTAEAVFTMVEQGKPLPPLDREVWS